MGTQRGAAQERGESAFSPRAILDQVFAQARGIGQGSAEFAGNVGATVRDNPIPVVLLAAGVASLIAAERMGKGGRAQGRVRGRLEDWDDEDDEDSVGSERIAALTERARTAAGEIGERARERGALLGDRMRETMSQVRDSGVQTLQDQPLLVAGLGLAVGAALGAALPLSARERQTLGPTRDRMLERARQAAREGAERVREGAERVREGAERVRGLAERAAGGRSTAGQGSRRQESAAERDARRQETEDAETDERMES